MGERRKIAVLVGDGMGDYPVPELGNRTPLQAAAIPNIRRIAAAGSVAMVQTVPDGMEPGSDVANLALMGFDASERYTGRAPIEAAGADVPMAAADVAYRCNLVTVDDGRMKDYSAGHIETDEAGELIAAVQAELGRDGLQFHAGISYRHLLIWRDGPPALETTPPHNIADKPVADYLPRNGEGADKVRQLMDASKAIFAEHPVNARRVAAGKNPATQVWLWGQGTTMQLASYRETYGLRGVVISAVDLVRGLGKLAGLTPIIVEGATGFIDTNYAGKVAAAIEALREQDFAFVHIEAPDECGHLGDAKLKTQAIEAFDAKVVGPVLQYLQDAGKPYRVLICTDHRTPVALRGHTSEPVPMAVLDGPVANLTDEANFDETVDNGIAQGFAYERIQELLRG